MFAHDLGIDVWEAIDAASTKPFGYMRFTPGPGVGGHCLPVDPSYLSWQVKRRLGQSFRFVELANDVNEHMPDYVVRRLVAALNERGQGRPRAAASCCSASRSRRTSATARECPSRRVAELLRRPRRRRCGPPTRTSSTADVPAWRSPRSSCTPDELAAADAVVLLVDHDAFDRATRRRARPLRARHPRLAVRSADNVERL